jgi:transposase InsO family protein
MLKDAIKIVNVCFQCKSNNVGRIYFHRAQSTRVSSIFERIAIDLVLRLPVVDYFFSILVITKMIVDTMLSNIGFEHRVTSAYHPNTNGQNERFNATLISRLRKNCENILQIGFNGCHLF